MSRTNLEIANALEEMTIRIKSIILLAGIDDPESMCGFGEAQTEVHTPISRNPR